MRSLGYTFSIFLKICPQGLLSFLRICTGRYKFLKNQLGSIYNFPDLLISPFLILNDEIGLPSWAKTNSAIIISRGGRFFSLRLILMILAFFKVSLETTIASIEVSERVVPSISSIFTISYLSFAF